MISIFLLRELGSFRPPTHNDLRRRYSLPDVSLRMFYAVNEQAADCTRQHRTADTARLLVTSLRDHQHSPSGFAQSSSHLGQHRFCEGAALHLAGEGVHLDAVQRSFLRISQQAIEASRYMPKMKRHRCDSEWSRIHLGIAQACAPSLDVLGREFKGMQYLPPQRIDLGQRPSQPWLNHQLASCRSTRKP
jgi:hypothetical protein